MTLLVSWVWCELSSPGLEPSPADSREGTSSVSAARAMLSAVIHSLKPDINSINIGGKNTRAVGFGPECGVSDLQETAQRLNCFSALKKGTDISKNL